MADLKLDLINKLNNDKYYCELEMVRLANNQNKNYKKKIKSLSKKMIYIGNIETQITLIEKYFKEPNSAKKTETNEKPPTKQTHQGQTHGE